MEIKYLKRIVWFLGISLAILIIFLPGYTKLQELRDKNRQLDREIKRINSENIILQEQFNLIQNDPLYQEKVAREKMGIVRKGEIPFKIESEE